MTKYTRITGKVFGSSATATGNDPEIGQFGSALAGTYNGTTDVATIQNLPAWQNGFIGAVTPTTQFAPLPEMTGFGKVLSHQICYLLQQGVAEYDSGTTYYIGNWVSYNSSLYVAKVDNFSNQLPTNTTYWNKFTGGSSRNLGEYVTSSLPLTDTTLHLADGALLTQTDYPELYSYIANLYNSLPSGNFSPASQNANLGSNNWSGIAYGNNKFVAVNSYGNYSTSTDGTTWTSPATMVSGINGQTAIAYGGNQFISITNDGIVLTSTDGTTWTRVGSGSPLGNYTSMLANWIDITFGNGKFIAMLSTGLLKYSTDGTTWTSTTDTPLGSNFTGICFGNGKFIAIDQGGDVCVSDNGISGWTQIYTSILESGVTGWSDIVYNNLEFIAITSSGYISTSETGDSGVNTWTVPTQDSNLGNNSWTSEAYGNLKTIALGTTGYISTKELPSTNVFTTEADWQTSYTTYGECGKYVYNSGANTVRIPAVNSYFTNTYDTQKVGNLTEASLPNIKGAGILNDDVSFCSGALYDSGSVSTTNSEPGGSTSKLVKFDASRSNSIYSDTATTVNTQSIKQLVYIVVKQ